MKEKVKPGGRWRMRARKLGALLASRQKMQVGARTALTAAAAALLTALPVAGAPVPLAAAVSAALPLPSMPAAVAGCVAGYLLRWGAHDGLWPAALALILPAVSFLLRRSAHRDVAWFLPAAHTVAAAAVGVGFLWQLQFPQRELGQFFLGLLLIFAGSAAGVQAFRRRRRGAMALIGWCLLAAASTFCIWNWLHFGLVAAVFFTAVSSAQPEAMAVAAGCGVALELTAPVALPYTAFLCVASALCRPVRRWGAFYRGTALLLVSALFCWLFAGVHAQMILLSCIGGTVASLPVSRLELFGRRDLSDAAMRLQQQLQQSADVLLRLHDSILAPQRRPDSDPDAAVLFDHVADQVCRACANWQLCWQTDQVETYHALSRAAAPILRRGKAEAEDFPAPFAARCRNLPEFILSVNRRLDEMLCRRQYRARQQENRELLKSQYLLLSRYLQSSAELDEPASDARYLPEVAARAMGRNGRTVSGDRGVSFHGPAQRFFIVLCDGMGTGRAAAAESSAAIRTLSGLLRAGMDAASALELLNSAYVLRDDGCFSTVDLLQIDLGSGDSVLLKWGAAPSYLKRAGSVRRLGEPTVPPGLDVYGLRGAQRIRLTLQSGDLLVLASDGAKAAETERRIAQSKTDSLKTLTEQLVSAARPDDDVTVVAVQLNDAPAA